LEVWNVWDRTNALKQALFLIHFTVSSLKNVLSEKMALGLGLKSAQKKESHITWMDHYCQISLLLPDNKTNTFGNKNKSFLAQKVFLFWNDLLC